MYKKLIKPFLDFVTAGFLLVATLPLTLITAVVLSISNQGSPFFTQRRPGKNAQVFKIIKFRTMNSKKDAQGNLLPDKDRLTALGVIVRKLSIDELPQLVNVLKGEMSLVGPRPLLPAYLSLYNSFQFQRHLVRPGITGWAQVNGRNAISWETKFEHDVYYVRHLTFGMDIKILWLTIIKVIKGSGITDGSTVTTAPFRGSK
ncbi:MAG: sugar transferase [Nonlabens sp.]